MASILPAGCSIPGLVDKKSACPICGTLAVCEPNNFAYFSGGALYRYSKDLSSTHKKLEGFLSLGFHGAHDSNHSLPSASVAIAAETLDGQFECYFCSVACMRIFFNRCIDELEKKLLLQNDD